MALQYKVYPAVVAALVALLYLGSAFLFGADQTAAESKVLIRPPLTLQPVYAGQLDRYITNEIGAMVSTDALASVAKGAGKITADQVRTAATVTATPGSDVVVVRVSGFAGDGDTKVNKLLVDQYAKGVNDRIQESVAQRSKKLTDELITLKTQIDDLSQKIAAATSAATARNKNTPVDPSIAAPVEISQRSLLVAQYTNAQSQLTTVQSQQEEGATAVQLLQEPTKVTLSRHISTFALAAAAMGGAALGLALALLHLRFRPMVGSWEEVERVMGNRRWVALDSRVPLGVAMPNPALDSLAMWLSEQGRRLHRVHMGIAQLPGQAEVTTLVQEATNKAFDTAEGATFEYQPIVYGAATGNASGLIVPFKPGKLSKKRLQEYVERSGKDTLVFVVEA